MPAGNRHNLRQKQLAQCTVWIDDELCRARNPKRRLVVPSQRGSAAAAAAAGVGVALIWQRAAHELVQEF